MPFLNFESCIGESTIKGDWKGSVSPGFPVHDLSALSLMVKLRLEEVANNSSTVLFMQKII